MVDNDLATLSRIYLALVHRNYKVEASDKPEETIERIRRFKPSLLIIGSNEFKTLNTSFKIPCILLYDKGMKDGITGDDEIFPLENPVPIDTLVKLIDELVI